MFILINVYGPTGNLEKKIVWDEIIQFMHEYQDCLIFLGGDFNTILNMNAKIGGSLQIPQSSKYFKIWCDYQNLIDIPLKNGKYTWNNK